MRIFKFLSSLIITVSLIYILDTRWVINGTPMPPIAKFLDPFRGFWRNIETPAGGKVPDPITIEGVQEKVTVVFDSLAIPHIFALNDLDLYFAQGYITARDRLWQMEFLTHAAAGRVSELIGAGPRNSIRDYDRGQRRLGMVYAAQRSLDALSSDQEAMIMVEKYTEGVNAYIKTLSYKNLPFEYKLLNYRPEPWTTLKCMLLLKSMAQSLCMRDKDMEMTNALKLFGAEMVSVLYPDHDEMTDPVVNNPGGWKFNIRIADSIPLALPASLINIKKVDGPHPANGSNNWAVSGSRTATGTPMLAGDPHLDLSLPSLWYAIQLNAPGINVFGASLPGMPCIVIGATDSIAWSETNAQRDVVDWYAISFQDKKRDKYLLDGQWVNTRKVIEKFAVRDSPIFIDTVVYTTWGPIPYDDNYRPDENRKQYAFRWLAHEPTREFTGFYKLNRAYNYSTFVNAVNYHSVPAQNFVFASLTGDIAMRVQGKFPLRRPLEGKFVLDGSKSSSGWRMFIPNEQNIFSRNPARGFESSANQYPADGTYPYYITAPQWESYRNRRINRVLKEMNDVTPWDLMRLQTDNYSLKAEESLPFMLSQLDTASLNASEKEAYSALKVWDYNDDPGSEGGSYFEAWFSNLMALTWDEMEDDNVLLERPTSYNTIRLMKQNSAFTFFDIKSTPEKETAIEVIRKAFVLGADNVAKWKEQHDGQAPVWSEYKSTFIRHLLRIQPLGVYAKGGGNRETVNALTKTHGPSWRMIVSLEKEGAKIWGVYPGGQSGNPGNPFYNNMTDAWVSGKYFEMRLLKDAGEADEHTLYTLQINGPGQ